jgi:hypothetical protein
MTEQTPQPEEKQYESIIHSILDKLHKPTHVQLLLENVREQLVIDRAYIRLDFSGPTTNAAIAASAYSLAQLHLIDLIINSGQVHEI